MGLGGDIPQDFPVESGVLTPALSSLTGPAASPPPRASSRSPAREETRSLWDETSPNLRQSCLTQDAEKPQVTRKQRAAAEPARPRHHPEPEAPENPRS